MGGWGLCLFCPVRILPESEHRLEGRAVQGTLLDLPQVLDQRLAHEFEVEEHGAAEELVVRGPTGGVGRGQRPQGLPGRLGLCREGVDDFGQAGGASRHEIFGDLPPDPRPVEAEESFERRVQADITALGIEGEREFALGPDLSRELDGPQKDRREQCLRLCAGGSSRKKREADVRPVDSGVTQVLGAPAQEGPGTPPRTLGFGEHPGTELVDLLRPLDQVRQQGGGRPVVLGQFGEVQSRRGLPQPHLHELAALGRRRGPLLEEAQHRRHILLVSGFLPGLGRVGEEEQDFRER